LAVAVAALCTLAVFAVYGEHGLLHLVRLQGEQRALEQTAFQLQQQNEKLRIHITKLQTDDRYLERLARERLGLVRPGEIVYRVR
jgi:cell division protein FtsB